MVADQDLSRLLAAARQGHAGAQKQLWSEVYAELRALARRQIARHPHGPARQPTSLAHETYLRMAERGRLPGADRREFLAAAARAMRDVQVEEARSRARQKHGGGRKRVPLEEAARVCDGDPAEALALVEALSRLERMDGRKGEIVMLRCFAGLTLAETAQELRLSVRTVAGEWRFARAWLRHELEKGDSAALKGGGRHGG
jgi:RNA polymerase sigma factor (TIGR02999 family)